MLRMAAGSGHRSNPPKSAARLTCPSRLSAPPKAVELILLHAVSQTPSDEFGNRRYTAGLVLVSTLSAKAESVKASFALSVSHVALSVRMYNMELRMVWARRQVFLLHSLRLEEAILYPTVALRLFAT